MDGKIAQFWEIGIVEGLLAKGRVADNKVETCVFEFGVLKGIIDMP